MIKIKKRLRSPKMMTDAAACVIAGQNTPNGYYNIERMMKYSIKKGAKVKICVNRSYSVA